MTDRAATLGFSLIELMVVVAITSILAISSTLMFARGGDAATRLIEAFQADAMALRRQAMVSGVDHQMHIRPGGWRSLRATADDGWTEVNAHPVADLQAPDTRILFRRDGWSSPFDVTLDIGGARIACRSANGEAPSCGAL